MSTCPSPPSTIRPPPLGPPWLYGPFGTANTVAGTPVGRLIVEGYLDVGTREFVLLAAVTDSGPAMKSTRWPAVSPPGRTSPASAPCTPTAPSNRSSGRSNSIVPHATTSLAVPTSQDALRGQLGASSRTREDCTAETCLKYCDIW